MQKTDSKSDRDKQVQVRLPAALHKQLKLALIQDDSSLADFFNEAANAYLKNPDKYRKAVGSIVCFRDLEKETNDAIALFGDKEANGIVLLKSYDDYYYGGVDDKGREQKGYEERIAELLQKYPLGEPIVGELN